MSPAAAVATYNRRGHARSSLSAPVMRPSPSVFIAACCGTGLLAALAASPSLDARQPASQEPSPQATVNGHTWTQRELFQRNIGAPEDQTTQFPPHKVIGNIDYVGTRSLASVAVATPAGLVLINSSYERNVPVLKASIEQLGFTFTDIKIVLGSHAHGDHQEGDALVKEMTGAQV